MTVATAISFPVCDWDRDIYPCKRYAKIRFEKSRTEAYRFFKLEVVMDESEGDYPCHDDQFIIKYTAQMNGPTERDLKGWYGMRLALEGGVATDITVRNIDAASKALKKAQKACDAGLFSYDIGLSVVEILRALKVNKVIVQAGDFIPVAGECTEWANRYVIEDKSMAQTHRYAYAFCRAFEKLCTD